MPVDILSGAPFYVWLRHFTQNSTPAKIRLHFALANKNSEKLQVKVMVLSIVKTFAQIVVSIVAGTSAVLYFSPHVVTGCPNLSHCNMVYDFVAGVVFVLIGLVIGPKRLLFIALLFPVLGFISQLEEFRTGESSRISWVLKRLPSDPLFQGGILILAVALLVLAVRNKHASQ